PMRREGAHAMVGYFLPPLPLRERAGVRGKLSPYECGTFQQTFRFRVSPGRLMDFQKELSWIDSQRDLMRDPVTACSTINTYPFTLPGPAKVGAEAENVLRSLGATTEWIDIPPAESIDSRGQITHRPLGRALRATKRAHAPHQIFLGIHLDT